MNMPRKMPPHIVLPNGMWRFVKRGSKSTRAHSPRKHTGGRMAKRKYNRRASGGGFGFGGGVGGTLKKVAIGAGAGILVGGLLGVGAGFLLGGVPGAAGAYFAPQIKNAISGVTGQVSYSGQGYGMLQ